MTKTSVVDLFCGAGGLSYGLKMAGLKISAGVDINPASHYPFSRMTKGKFVLTDVQSLSATELSRLFAKNAIKILAGCAPCQPFSTYANTRKSKDERWNLVNTFLELATKVNPDIVTMENVPKLKDTAVWAAFLEGLQSCGYNITYDVVQCSNFGVPQTRKRLVLIASKLKPVKLPAPSVGNIPTVRQAIQGLDPIFCGNSNSIDSLHIASQLSPENLKRIQNSVPGGTWRDWPSELRTKCHLKKSGDTFPSVYGRMEWDAPAPTITTQFYGYGSGRFGHPEQDRAISIREAALLQSFPKKYEFVAPGDKVTFRGLGILIGNAVPPKLGQAIGRAILEHLA